MVAGVATIAFSLVMSIAPAMAAKGGKAAATVKIHDAATGLEAAGQGNEPQVCEFWVGFSGSDPADTGSWQILSWPPTGNGTVVASGNYDTAGDGVDTTGVLALAEGHYRLETQSDADSNANQKTFWVECEATGTGSDPTDEAAPTDESEPTDEAAPTDESEPTDEAAPTDESEPTDEAAPTDESEPTDEAAPTDESEPTDEAAPTDESEPTDEAAPTDDGEGDVQGEEQTPPGGETEPTDQAAPTDEASPDQENPNATDEAAPSPEDGILAGNPGPVASPEAAEGGAAPAGGGATELPDTSIPVQPSGVLATIGVLLIIAAHLGTRHARSLPTA